MKEIFIDKRDNNFQYLDTLKRNRTKRINNHEFFVEGVRNINLAIKHNWKIKHWIYNSKKLSNWASEKIKSVKTEVNYNVSQSLLDELSDKTDKSELLAIIEMKDRTVKITKNPFIVIFDRPSKKGNLGAIMRSADAFGCDGIIIVGHSVDLYDMEVIRASMGSFFVVDTQIINQKEELLNLFDNLKNKFPNLKIISADEKGVSNLNETDLTTPTIILIGNENLGLSKFLLDVSNIKVKIPMVGEASSLNASNAAAIFMYELFTQRKK